VSRGQRNGSPRPLISVFWAGAATFYSSSSSIEVEMLDKNKDPFASSGQSLEA